MALRLGLLSTARINDAILRGAATTDEVEVTAVASRSPERATSYARERGLAAAYGDYDALLGAADVDAVYISLPNSLHVPWTLRALEAGKHVLVEKPLTRHAAEVERVFDAAASADRVVMEAFMYRHHPQTKRFAELVLGGAIGELRVVRASFTFTLASETDVRLDPELDGGALMDLGCYCVSTARLLAGEPERFAGVQTLAPSGVDIRFAAAMGHPNGVLSHFDCGFDGPRRQEVEAVGADGTATLRPSWVMDAPVIEIRRGDDVERLEAPPADRYGRQLENFARAVRGEEPALLGREDARGQARAIEALYAAAENPGPALSS